MKKLLFNWLPVLLYASLIFAVSSYPVQVAEGPDKILHFFEYALMGFFTTRGVLLTWNLPRGWGWLLGFLLAASLGALDELHQSMVPGRLASTGDALADALGALFGAGCFVLLGVLLYKSERLYPDAHKDCC